MTLIANGAFDRDGNRVPITEFGFMNKKTIELTASNTTATVPLFNLIGICEVRALYGVVTTALSSNVTDAYWQMNDGGATPDISLASGTTLSSFAAGSFISRRSLVSVALNGSNASAAVVADPVAATAMDVFMAFVAIQKTGGVATTIDFTYSTTNTPASGVIDFYIGWLPLTENSYITSI